MKDKEWLELFGESQPPQPPPPPPPALVIPPPTTPTPMIQAQHNPMDQPQELDIWDDLFSVPEGTPTTAPEPALVASPAPAPTVSAPAPTEPTQTPLWALLDGVEQVMPGATKELRSALITVEEPNKPPNQEEDYGDYSGDNNSDNPAYFKGLLIGQAGTGKTYTLKERIKENPKYGLLCATTGIAAVNLSTADCVVRTIHSVLGFYDLNSMTQAYQRGRLTGALVRVAQQANRLIVDEMSMMGKLMFEVLQYALDDVNAYKGVQERGGLGLMLVGDFLQLPPVDDAYVFESDKFAPYESNIEKLTKVYRQSDPTFLAALQAARCGDGETMVQALYSHPDVKFANQLDDNFDGTTIVATNEEVNRLNNIRLMNLKNAGKKGFTVAATRWGKEDSSWKNIPNVVELAEDSYIMILNNGGDGAYANGSCGWVRTFTPPHTVVIELHEPKTATKEVEIAPITRLSLDKHSEEKYGPLPEEKLTWTDYQGAEGRGARRTHGAGKKGYEAYCNHLTNKHKAEGRPGTPYYDFGEEMMVVGGITYLPVRLAYATTVHKSQGLSLDRCQIDYIGSGKGKNFFGSPGMSYVALSRVRTPQGLRIVGTPKDVEKKTNITRKVLRWA